MNQKYKWEGQQRNEWGEERMYGSGLGGGGRGRGGGRSFRNVVLHRRSLPCICNSLSPPGPGTL